MRMSFMKINLACLILVKYFKLSASEIMNTVNTMVKHI